MTVSLVKLVDGTEVMGKIKESTSEKIVINNPLKINYYSRTPVSTPSIALQRYLPFSGQEDIALNTQHVISSVEVKDGVVKYYESALNSIRTTVDMELDRTLKDIASETDEDTEGQVEVYKAVLEKLTTKATLN